MKTTTIGTAFRLKSGNGLSAKKMNGGKYPVFGGNGISGYHDSYMFEDPKLVIGRVGAYCGNIHLTEPNSWITDNALYVSERYEQYEDNYLVYLLKAANLNQYASQSGQPLISGGRLKNVTIPLPPLPEQRRIAAILDAADALRRHDKALIERYDALTQSVFHEMFGDLATNKFQWNENQLVEICNSKNDIKCGPFGTQLQNSEYKKEGVPLWGIKQINSRFAIRTEEFVSKEKALELGQYSIIPGDIVMSRKGNVGKCSIYPDSFPTGIMHSDVLRIRPNVDSTNPVFLLHQLRESRKIETQINNVSSGAIMAGINVGKLKNIRIAIPPLPLQQQFAARVEAIEAQKALVQESLAQSEALFGSLMQKAFKGEL